MSNIYLGCAIWGYRPWVGQFLPAGTSNGDMLKAYAERLTTVEINATFYAVPDQPTVLRWASDTPSNFRFCPKVPRAISHSGNLTEQIAATKAFVAQLQLLGAKLGPIFLQLGPSYSPAQFGDLQTWLAAWDHAVPLAVEVRHRGWFAPQAAQRLNGLLAEHGVGRVLVDVRPINTGATTDQVILDARRKKPSVPYHVDVTAPFVLLRFMGHPDLAIDQPLLEQWADTIVAMLNDGLTVYSFMHCPVEERSPEMCELLAQALVARGIEYPLPTPPEPMQQLSLF
ncbi:DUF72 domain-containing protein [Herpetosiphon llansteffanensis]|uniref:DUF72 domain-containing protein n=1 Tax=Herpetosiphon llansteffanensis TaxID=2094568 RepID=UPI000D7D15D3|nr:DUF72 domain-containing protein [Herpetosiphon llansteffanensis]